MHLHVQVHVCTAHSASECMHVHVKSVTHTCTLYMYVYMLTWQCLLKPCFSVYVFWGSFVSTCTLWSCVFILFMLCVYHFTCAVEEIQRRDLMYSQYGQSQAGPQPEESLSYLTLNTGQGLAVSQCC